MHFEKCDITSYTFSPFESIGKDFMLITATDSSGKYNQMTASWGGVGVLWGKNVVFCFIRPQRYTNEFASGGESVTLSFFGKEYRNILNYCGKVSGRDENKVEKCNLHPICDGGYVYYEESDTVICGRKLYVGKIEECGFYDVSLLKNYKNNDFHFVYIYEITDLYKKIK